MTAPKLSQKRCLEKSLGLHYNASNGPDVHFMRLRGPFLTKNRYFSPRVEKVGLSNLYMRRFVLGWKSLGYGERLQARIVNYADDCAPRARGRAGRLAYSRATAQPMRERRPLGTCLQEPVSNHLRLLWAKATVVSTRRKRPGKNRVR